MQSKGKRIVLGKLGLDGHDTGLRVIAKWLESEGYEVIYAGLYNSPESIVQTAIEEGANMIGISSLEFGHMYHGKKLLKELKENNLDKNIKVIFGGVIPADDAKKLEGMGVAAVFTPGTGKNAVIQKINSIFANS